MLEKALGKLRGGSWGVYRCFWQSRRVNRGFSPESSQFFETFANGNAKLLRTVESLNSKDTRHKISGASCYEDNSLNRKFQTFGKPRKIFFWGRCWAKIGLRKTQACVEFEAARFRVLDRHRSTKPTTASLINSERSALVRGSDRP